MSITSLRANRPHLAPNLQCCCTYKVFASGLQSKRSVQCSFHGWNSVPQRVCLKAVVQRYKSLGIQREKPFFPASGLNEPFICCTSSLYIYNYFTIYVCPPFFARKGLPFVHAFNSFCLYLIYVSNKAQILGSGWQRNGTQGYKAVKRGV